jgi:hypothetical protein
MVHSCTEWSDEVRRGWNDPPDERAPQVTLETPPKRNDNPAPTLTRTTTQKHLVTTHCNKRK